MTNGVLWALGADDRRWPRLSGDVEADVGVIGAGIVGLAAAHVLASAGLSVAVLEARRVGHKLKGAAATAGAARLAGLCKRIEQAGFAVAVGRALARFRHGELLVVQGVFRQPR